MKILTVDPQTLHIKVCLQDLESTTAYVKKVISSLWVTFADATYNRKNCRQ